MSLQLPDHWLWDHWFLHDGEKYHLFFLRASRALHDPDRRHFRASMGHAISSDLESWTVLPDAVVHSDGPAFDDKAIWTGSAIMKPGGGIRLFYTGISHAEGGMVQRIGWADSDDGITFHRSATEPVVADSRWYQTWSPGSSSDEAWRDPFVFEHEGRWHMLITARGKDAELKRSGVVGHAASDDLEHWEVLPPLSEPNVPFGQLEVMQSREIDGKHLLLFSCGADMHSEPSEGGVWVAEGESPIGPWDIEHVRYVHPTELYAGQLFQDLEGVWRLGGFTDIVEGSFIGGAVTPLLWEDVELQQPAWY